MSTRSSVTYGTEDGGLCPGERPGRTPGPAVRIPPASWCEMAELRGTAGKRMSLLTPQPTPSGNLFHPLHACDLSGVPEFGDIQHFARHLQQVSSVAATQIMSETLLSCKHLVVVKDLKTLKTTSSKRKRIVLSETRPGPLPVDALLRLVQVKSSNL